MKKTDKRFNLFIVRSPLQLINAIEAKHYFKTENNILCIIHNTSIVNSSQMNKLISLYTWDKIIEHNKNNQKNNLLKNVKFIKNLRKNNYCYLFSGDLGNINIALISSVDKVFCFLIDDGTSTLNLHKKFLNPNVKKKKTLNIFIREYRYRLFGINCSLTPETINYFTMFNILPYKKEKIIKNNFLFLKNNFKNIGVDEKKTVYLLGQNFVEIEAIHEKVYIEYLEKIINYYKNQQIIYYPHRSEEVSSAYNRLKNKNFIIKKSEQPIEIELLIKGTTPTVIASFVSSALFTLHQIFPETLIQSFIIKSDDLLSFQKTMKMLYKNQDPLIEKINL